MKKYVTFWESIALTGVIASAISAFVTDSNDWQFAFLVFYLMHVLWRVERTRLEVGELNELVKPNSIKLSFPEGIYKEHVLGDWK